MLVANMKSGCCVSLLFSALFLYACAGQQSSRIVFLPNEQSKSAEETVSFESLEIIESQNGPGRTGIPEWVIRYYNEEARGVETLAQYSGRYAFVGENRGTNINALQQWAKGFSVTHDLPRLVALRVEQRLAAPASLYPDDEYGEYFETMVKKALDSQYPDAVKEETFWIKRRVNSDSGEDAVTAELPQENSFDDLEQYEFFILISIDKESMQRQIREMMTGIKTGTPPTREQASAINKVQQAFFEEF